MNSESNFLSLSDIETQVKNLSEVIDAPVSLIPSFGFSRDLGYPHVDVTSTGYHYIITERGVELERKSSTNLDDLLYWIFRDVTSSMAIKYEMENRRENQDFRILLFEKQIELMSKLDTQFGNRLRSEIDQIIKLSPFMKPHS